MIIVILMDKSLGPSQNYFSVDNCTAGEMYQSKITIDNTIR
jgi:hypothetical protein